MLVTTLFLTSCSKDGPQGPDGIQGEAGALGPKGDKGDKGDPGNANVKSYTSDISTASWTTVGTSTAGYLKLDISATTVLTSSVINNSVMLVYVLSTDHPTWALLPYYTARNISVEYDINVGKLTLERSQNGKPNTQSNFYKVKLVIIGTSDDGTIRRTAPIDYRDYNAVEEYYHLEKSAATL